jgi:NAD(P)-dependent dehydrogenase (short-subunit alcohol dehydrogenase family)
VDEGLRGKVVLTTGGTSGIGRATALRFAAAGARVAIVGRNAAALQELSEEVRKHQVESLAITADLTIEAEAERAMKQTVDRFSQLDVLVNAAGILMPGSIENTSLEQWDTMMNINLRSVFHQMKLAVPLLEKTRGNIVNVSSVTGLRSFPGVLAYCVSKAAVDQLTRCTALELAPKGIRVNAVNPGVVVTDIHRRGGMSEGNYAAFLEHSKTTHPLGRVGEADEVADLILYLASERAGWITGATYSIDGGRALTCAR